MPDVLYVSEQLLPTTDPAQLPIAKTYYHRFNGAKFPLPDGRHVIFTGGQFVTADLMAIRELDRVVDKLSSFIYTKSEVIEAVVQQEAKVAKEAGRRNDPAIQELEATVKARA